MLLTLAVILFIAWILGFVAFHIASGAFHILLGAAIVLAIIHLFTGRRTTAV